MAFKRQRTFENNTSDEKQEAPEYKHFHPQHSSSPSYLLAELRKNIDVNYRKKQHVQRAYHTMIHDIRHESTILLHFLDTIDTDNIDDPEDTVRAIKKMVSSIVKIGQCPLSGEALDNNTFINICGHIFDKQALYHQQPSVCPKCSHKIVLPRNM